MSEFQPDLTLAYRCISVHWSLPVQCERDKSHADNWHWARHPDTGRAIRYRRTLGVYRTEEVGADAAWHALPIPPPVRKDVGFLLAEVERLTAEGVAASERRDYFKAKCEQQERDHAETVAEAEKLRGVVQRVRHLHRVHRCDGPAVDCLCADDRAEAGGDLCGHCTRPWPCPTAIYVLAQDGGAS